MTIRLIEDFDRLIDTPDAVPRLRRFILDLAVRGKLVEQDPKDEPAGELLKRINVDAVWPDMPKNWLSASTGELLNLQYGRALSALDRSDQGPVPVFGSNGIVSHSQTALTERPAIIIGRKGSAGALNLCDGPSWTTDVAYFLIPPDYFDIRFLFLAFQTLDLARLGKGVKPGLSRSEFYQLPVVVPPLAEQHRIVAKVDELMALCDELEAAQTKREKRRDRLVAATLHGLNTNVVGRDGSPSRPDHPHPNTGGFGETALPGSFEKNARFYFNHLPRLTTRPEHIHQLRQTILNLAVRGKLVPQDPKDEPASELLARIETLRTRLLTAGYPNQNEANNQLRKQRSQVLPVGLAPLPPGWRWATLMQCSALIVDCHNKTAPYSSNGVILLRTTNVRDGKLNLSQPKFVDEQTYARWSARYQPEAGDILITREAPMGEVCIIPVGMKVCLGQRMMLAKLIPSTIDQKFLLNSLLDPQLMDRVQDKPVGATVQHLRVGGVETLLVALPPLAEQHRIVAKVDELMALCDKLEARIASISCMSGQLLKVVFEEALPAGKTPIIGMKDSSRQVTYP